MKTMLVGKTGCGKTTLTQRLYNQSVVYSKTQMVSYENDVIDTPGEYIENKFYMKALNVTATGADIIVLLQSSLDEDTLFPPNFSTMFLGKEVIGVVTKLDLNPDCKLAQKYLENAGATEIFYIGFDDEKEMARLRERLGIKNES